MGAAAFALVLANSPLGPAYGDLLQLPLVVQVGTWGIAKPILLWTNDGLMAVFFLLVGLELKREVLEGHLSTIRQALLPGFAAVGGMAFPATVYALLNGGDPIAMKGWAIPAATDIAFALGILSLLGNRVPPALKAFLLSVAIFDDLGAIIIIALFYSAELSLTALTVGALLIMGLWVLNRAGVRRPTAYFLLGVPLWVAVLKSGVHATLAGVVLALFIPHRVRGPGVPGSEGQGDDHASTLLQLEHKLHPWVAFGILPVFALANAGVPLLDISLSDLVHPVPLGIIGGLVLGKLVGISTLSALAVGFRVAKLPEGVKWSQLVGVALLCGVGFTMSLFIASLAFEQGGEAYFGLERLGILSGSLISGLGGYLVLRAVAPKRDRG